MQCSCFSFVRNYSCDLCHVLCALHFIISNHNSATTMNVKGNVIIKGDYIEHIEHIEHYHGSSHGNERAEEKQTIDFGDVEDAEVVEVSNGESLPDGEPPASVQALFAQPRLVEPYVRSMVACYTDGKPLSLALMYCVLRDYSLLRTQGEFKLYVQALMDWKLLPAMNDEECRKMAAAISSHLRAHTYRGVVHPALDPDFRRWTDATKRAVCENMASVFGDKDGDTIHYKYK